VEDREGYKRSGPGGTAQNSKKKKKRNTHAAGLVVESIRGE